MNGLGKLRADGTMDEEPDGESDFPVQLEAQEISGFQVGKSYEVCGQMSLGLLLNARGEMRLHPGDEFTIQSVDPKSGTVFISIKLPVGDHVQIGQSQGIYRVSVEELLSKNIFFEVIN